MSAAMLPDIRPEDSDADEVDVVVLTRDGRPPPDPVRAAIEGQSSDRLAVRLHVVAGPPLPGDVDRYQTIARARNLGRLRGDAPWLMFVDDDVILEPGCLAHLLHHLKNRPEHAALAARLRDARPAGGAPGIEPTGPSAHIALGAILFRRDVLAFLRLRSTPDRCECRCAADDLRRAGFAVEYLPGAGAIHDRSLTREARRAPDQPRADRGAPGRHSPRILCSFDRAHLNKFLRLFLQTLRAYGNTEEVTTVAYGLSPTEQRRLASLPGIDAICRPGSPFCPAASRPRDFAEICSAWPADTPVAYWDAADVSFQARLGPLWDLVRANPDRLLVAREGHGLGIADNPVAMSWTTTIPHEPDRRRALELLWDRPYLNSGFAAGTARVMAHYGREAERLLVRVMAGSTDWGDQTALNIYCHADPARWKEVSRGWNYAMCRLRPGEVSISAEGRVVASDGTPIYVAHGNAKRLPQLDLSHLRD